MLKNSKFILIHAVPNSTSSIVACIIPSTCVGSDFIHAASPAILWEYRAGGSTLRSRVLMLKSFSTVRTGLNTPFVPLLCRVHSAEWRLRSLLELRESLV